MPQQWISGSNLSDIVQRDTSDRTRRHFVENPLYGINEFFWLKHSCAKIGYDHHGLVWTRIKLPVDADINLRPLAYSPSRPK